MEENPGRALADAYYRYLAADHQSKLAEQPSRVAATQLLEHRRHVMMLWQRLFD